MFSLLYCVYGYRNYQFTNNDRYFGACYFSNYLLDGEMKTLRESLMNNPNDKINWNIQFPKIKTKKYVPVLNEQQIVKEILRRVKYLERDRDTQLGGKDAYFAWRESEEGEELEALQRMLEQSDYWDGEHE